MQSIEFHDLDKLVERLKGMREAFPDAQRAYHERVGARLKQEVSAAVYATVNTTGRVAGWQTEYLGSGGGYAAVRATDSSTGDNSPGAITNYLENGHKSAVGKRSDSKRKYKSRVKIGYAAGRHFYQSVRSRAMAIAMSEMDAFLNELTEAANK